MKYLWIAALAIAGTELYAQSCDDHVAAGRMALTRTNIALAKTHFAAAATQCPGRDDARFLYAVTRVLAIPSEPTGSNFLNRLGLPAEGRSIFRWKAWAPADTNRVLLAPTGVNAAEAAAMLRTNILPALTGAAADLGSITDADFMLTLSERETTVTELSVDYGDVLMLRAVLHAFEYFGYTLQSWNFDLPLTALRVLHDQGMLSVQQVLADYPQLLTFTTTNELLMAKAAFQAAIDRYFEASAFIRGREHNLQRLFTLDLDEAEGEEHFRCVLSSVRASLQSPTIICTASNYTLHVARHFDGETSLRDLLPMFAGNRPVVGTLPDSTLGGVIYGLTDIALEGLIGRFVPMAVMLGSGGIIPPHRFISEFRTLPDRVYALEYSTNLRTWNEISRFFSEGGTYGFVDTGEAEFRYYRLTELYQYYTLAGQVVNSCSGQPVAGATLQVSYPPESIETTDLDGRFEFRLPDGYYEVYVSAPGYSREWFDLYVDEEDDDIRFRLEPLITVPPPNDNFTNRIPLTNFPATAQGWICASEDEDDDPVGYNSMWWTWTAPFSGEVALSLDAGDYGGGYVAVYEGAALLNLTRLAFGYDEVRFEAVAGTTYQFAAAPFGHGDWRLRVAAPPQLAILAPSEGQTFTAPADILFLLQATDLDGSVTELEIFGDDLIARLKPSGATEQFTWQNVPAGHYDIRVRATGNHGDKTVEHRRIIVRPANDAFANRILLPGSDVLARGTARAATAEIGEPQHGGNQPERTIWWSWTSPFTGPATIIVKGDGYPRPTVAVYTGSQLNALTEVASDSGPHLPRQPTFAASSGTPYAIVVSGYEDEVKLQILPTAPPFVSIIAPMSNQVFGLPTNVVVQIDAADSDGSISHVELAVNGTKYDVDGGHVTLSNLVVGDYFLRAKAIDDDGAIAFSEPISITLRVRNDHFADRIALTGAAVNVTGTTVRSSGEFSEPYHAGYYPSRTVWWSWTAPGNGTVTISTAGSDFDTVLAVYVGVNLGVLGPVASNNNFGDQTSRVSFSVTSGTTYQIAVGSTSSFRFGTVQVSIVLQ